MIPTITAVKEQGWLYRQYHKLLQASDSPHAFRAFCAVSFAESSFFPLPPDLLMIPMILSNRNLAWRLAFWGTVTSVAGGIVGYGIGYFLFALIGQWIISFYGLQQSMQNFQNGFAEWGFLIIILKGLTPIPYKLVTIASGVAHYPLGWFVIASVICRAMRFYLLATLLWFFGPWAKTFIERYLTLFLCATLVMLAIGFVIVKMLL